MTKYYIFMLASVCLLRPAAVFASGDQLGPQELVTRCFQSIANIRLSYLDSRRAAVTDQASALALCDKLIDAPQISPSTGLIVSTNSTIKLTEAKDLVRRFQQFHESIFKSDKFENTTEDQGFTKMIYDTGAPAAYFTLATFGSNPDYSLAVTEPSALSIIRGGSVSTPYANLKEVSSGKSVFQAYDWHNQYSTDPQYSANGNLLTPIDRGLLNGIKRTSPSDSSNFNSSADHAPSTYNTSKQSVWRETLGAGFLGDPSFILLNGGIKAGATSNGSMALPRRWSREVMARAFCRNGPYFGATNTFTPTLSADISTNTQAPAFRQNANCMKCHETMDPLAIGIRNISFEQTRQETAGVVPSGYTRCAQSGSGNCSNIGLIYAFLMKPKSSSLLSASTALPDAFLWPVPASGDPNFHLSKVHGRLSYKSAFNGGAIVSDEFSANGSGNTQLSNLGNLVKNSPDYYFCGALRYFEMLSGVHFEIDSDSLPNAPSTVGSYETQVWNTLKTETTAFNTHHNPKTLLKSLIRTTQFQSRSWGRKLASTAVVVTSVSPNSGVYTGGTSITISGSNFSTSSTVSLGGSACSIASITSTEIHCTTSAIALAGPVSVTVVDGTQSAVLANSFTYLGNSTYSSIKHNIFEQKCTGCHNSASPSAGLDLTSYNPSNSNNSGVLDVVTSGDAVNSTLYLRVQTGGGMPPSNNLSTGEINNIRDWINAGAQNN